jgi:hypothetical protein
MKGNLISSWYIDDNHVLHTYIGDKEHVSFSDVHSDEEAEHLIEEENELL